MGRRTLSGISQRRHRLEEDVPRTVAKKRPRTKRSPDSRAPLEDVIRQVTRLFDRRDLNYSQTAHVIKEVRKRLGLAPERKPKKIPEIIAKAYQRDAGGGLIVKSLWVTMVRVSELVALRIGDLHLDDGYAKIRSGKGGKDQLVVVSRPLGRNSGATSASVDVVQCLFHSADGRSRPDGTNRS